MVNKNLKWAYYFVLLAALIFVLFEGKRKQRPIPIVNPPQNQTLLFTGVVANMFFEKNDHKSIANYLFENLMDYIRNQLRIPTQTIDNTFYEFVASRSQTDIKNVKKLFAQFEIIQNKTQISKEELLNLNTQIEQLKRIK